MQLEHTTPHQRVRRERIGAVLPAIDSEHAKSMTRQQHRRRCTGAPRPHDHHVITRIKRCQHRPRPSGNCGQSALEVGIDVFGKPERVRADTIDEIRVSPAEKIETNCVESGEARDAAVMTDLSLCCRARARAAMDTHDGTRSPR